MDAVEKNASTKSSKSKTSKSSKSKQKSKSKAKSKSKSSQKSNSSKKSTKEKEEEAEGPKKYEFTDNPKGKTNSWSRSKSVEIKFDEYDGTENDTKAEKGEEAENEIKVDVIMTEIEEDDQNKMEFAMEALETEIKKMKENRQKSINIKLKIKQNPEYLVLAFSVFVLILNIIILYSMSGSVNGKMTEQQQAFNNALASKLHFEATDSWDLSETYYIGDWYGWGYAAYRDFKEANIVSGNDRQYPLGDIYVRFGDTLIFKQNEDIYDDDLWLVPKSVYDSCDFSKEGVLENDHLLLATPSDLYNINKTNETAKYELFIEDFSNYTTEYFGDALFEELMKSDILYFTSSVDWDHSKKDGSCKSGLKIKVIIDKSYRDLMPVQRQNNIWRALRDKESVKSLDSSIGHIARALMLKQFSDEQRARSQGDSGLINVEGLFDGNNEWNDGEVTTQFGATGAIHDHSENLEVVGLGQIEAVLNGVEFRTKHNDYKLVRPSTSNKEYGVTEPIEFPEVPPEVKNAGSVAAEIEEMQEWFRAFKNQDKSHRDYTKYFKPILCYLEGAWIENINDTESKTMENDKMRWMANNGRKSILENLANLPASIRNLKNDIYPMVSHWDYNIVCHPLKDDLTTQRFRVADDLNVQLFISPKTREELYFDKRARFHLNKFINLDNITGDNQWSTGRKRWNYLDYLMEQIPGKDNFFGSKEVINDELPDGTGLVLHYKTDEVVNAGYYGRYYKTAENDAMGATGHRRTYSDRNIFFAKTTQKIVSAIKMNFEVQDTETGIYSFYPTDDFKFSYAIPLEIIYLTPLTKWNPYNIKEKTKNEFDYARNGDCGASSTAFDGWTVDNAYFTPSEFYDGLTPKTMADTAKDNVCALGGDGNSIHSVYPSGHFTVFPSIGGGVGRIRQRYPIYHIHSAGSAEFKELKALQDIILPKDYDDITNTVNDIDFFDDLDQRDLYYGFQVSLQGGTHQHIVYIPGWKIKNFWTQSNSNHVLEVESEEKNGHRHTLRIWREKDVNNEWKYHLKSCRCSETACTWTDDECADDKHDRLNRYIQ